MPFSSFVNVRWIAWAVTLTVVASGCSQSTSTVGEQPKKPKPSGIVLLGLPTNEAFHNAMRSGFEEAASNAETEVKWMESDPSGGVEGQTKQLSLLKDYKAAAVWPVDPSEMIAPLKEFTETGPPLFAFGGSLTEDGVCQCTIGTDHFNCGKLAAEFVSEKADEELTLAVLPVGDHDYGAVQRSFGCLYGLREFENINVVSKDKKTGQTDQSAAKAIQALLDEFGEELDAIIAVSTRDTHIVLEKAAAAESFEGIVIGFGIDPKLYAAINDGRLAATIVEDPWMLGFATVMAIQSHFDDELTGEIISSGEHLVTKETMNQDPVRRVLTQTLTEVQLPSTEAASVE